MRLRGRQLHETILAVQLCLFEQVSRAVVQRKVLLE